MTKYNRTWKIWEILEHEKPLGLTKRLYSTKSSCHIYCTLRYPENYYGIAFTFNKNTHIDVSIFENLRDMNIILFKDETFENSQLLVFELLDKTNRDIFAILCENLIQSILFLKEEQKIITTVLSQLKKWKTLFEKKNNSILTTEQQQGLFGELHFLEKFLRKPNINFCEVLKSWIGTQNTPRDFEGATWALEVKTTSTNKPQKISINGERQLDESLLDNLFLFHFSIESTQNRGETLYQKTLKIKELLTEDYLALAMFNAKLFEVGYSTKDESLYNKNFYLSRSEDFYKIEGLFPRIKENELRSGICDVKYSIILSMCNEFLISENKLFTIIQAQ